MGKQKTDAELISKINYCITELVHNKEYLKKAYNYYNGVLDAEQYKYLEDNFGLGNPTSMEFIPLIKKHIDALVGEYLEMPIIPKLSCKDKETISKIDREKKLKIADETIKFFREKLVTNLTNLLMGKPDAVDTNISKAIEDTKKNVENDFVSDYEVASQNVLEYLIQSETISIKEKLRRLYLDFLITGECYFKAVPTGSGTDIDVEIYSPLNTFVEINPSCGEVNKSKRSVIRKWYTFSDLMLKYGKFLTKEQIDDLKDNWEKHSYSKNAGFWIQKSYPYPTGYPCTYGVDAGDQVYGFPLFENSIYNTRFIPIYEVEWIEPIKKEDGNYRLERYSEVKIGEEIYILNNDPDEDVLRTISDPDNASISLNGLYYINKSNKPYSLVLACSALQDKYNLLWFYRDTVIANSGTTGERIDVSKLPKFLGESLTERLVKWNAYYKAGVSLLDSSQEGDTLNNTIVGEYDNTLRAQAIQAITLAMQSVEDTCSSITGVFRERLNGIQQYDAVRNVQVGARNSFIVTKQYFHQMDLVSRNMLSDCLNLAKSVFKKGLKGVLVLGDERQKIFTAYPKYFRNSDYDIHILSASEASMELEQVQAMATEFIKSGQVSPDILVDTINTKSVTEYKDKLKKALNSQGKIQEQFQQLQQKLEQAQQQIQEYEKQLKQAGEQLKKYDDFDNKIKEEELKLKREIDWYNAKTQRSYYEAKAKAEEKKIDIELGQLYDGNPYNDQIKLT